MSEPSCADRKAVKQNGRHLPPGDPAGKALKINPMAAQQMALFPETNPLVEELKTGRQVAESHRVAE